MRGCGEAGKKTAESPVWVSTASSTIISSSKGGNSQRRAESVEWGYFVIQAFAFRAAGRLQKNEKKRFERVLDELRWYTRDDSHEKPVLCDLRQRSGAVSFEISLNQGKDDITCDRTCVFLPLGSEKVNHEKGDQVERGNHAESGLLFFQDQAGANLRVFQRSWHTKPL